MRYSVVKTVLLLSVAMLLSCKVEMPEHILPPEKMEAVLYDYHLTQSMASTLASADYKEKLMYAYLYDKHNLTKEKFDESLAWYNRYPKHMKGIYKNLEDRLQREVDVLGGAKALQDDAIDLDMVNLAVSVAELWTGSTVRMLSPTPLNNKVQFSFEAPKDSSFIVGDSLVFSFSATFFSGNVTDLKQEVYAAILLEYGDDSYFTGSLNIEESGMYTLPVPRNFNSYPKSMSGYLYYLDNDTTYNSRVVLDGLSLKRLHPAKSVKKKSGK